MHRYICVQVIIVALTASATFTPATAQNRPSMPAPRERQTLNSANLNARIPNTNYIMPRRGYIHPVQLVNNFSRNNNPPAKNIFLTKNMVATRTNGMPPNGAKTMDYRPGQPIGSHVGSSTVSSSMNSRILTTPEVTKVVNGTRVSYRLLSPQYTSEWPEGAQLNPKPSDQSQDKYNPDLGMNCHTVNLSFSCQSKSFMNAQPEQQGSLLMPGMIYTYEDICNGNLTHQNMNNNRFPVTLFVDAASQGQTSVDVPNPSAPNINNAVQTLRKNFGGNPGGGDILYQLTKTENTAEQMLAVTAGGSYGAYSGSASFNHQDSKYHLYYTIDAIKELFTVNVSPDSPSIYPPGYNAPADGYPVMIGNVTYGARVLANMDIALESSSNSGDLNFQYNSIGASAFAKLQASIQQKKATVTINGYLVGFPARFGGTFTADLSNFENLMNTFFSGCDYNDAKPIQYTLVNLQGDEMGISSITDKTTIQECTPANETFTLQSAVVSFKTGDDDKNDNSEFWLSLGSGNEHNPHWCAQIYDNHSKFNSSGNDYTLSFPTPAPIDFNEFESNGGVLAFKLIAHGHSDDWDFAGMTITLNFISQHGVPKQKTLSLNSFRISDTDSHHDSKDVLFKSVSDDKYDTY
jgi:hypothetical protein